MGGPQTFDCLDKIRRRKKGELSFRVTVEMKHGSSLALGLELSPLLFLVLKSPDLDWSYTIGFPGSVACQ